MESMNWEHRHLSSLVCALEILIGSTHYCTNNFSMTSRKFKSTHSNSNISQLRKDNVYKKPNYPKNNLKDYAFIWWLS